jgi:hypothetical protein
VLLTDRRSESGRWRTIAAIEVGLAAGAVVLDVIVPTIAILGLVAASLAVRREHLVTLGLRRLADPARTVLAVLALVIAWTLFQLAVVMPVLNHLTGTRQDLSELADVEGIGVVVTFLDGLFFTALRLHYGSLWAAILAHGINNTIGLVALFLIGPVYGFW